MWLNHWRLKVAPSKCCYMIFSKNKKSGEYEEMCLSMYGSEIPLDKTGEMKFLGIKFDKQMNFIKHIDDLINKCNNRLNVLRILKHRSWRVDNKTLLVIYYALIRSIIDYSLILYPILSNAIKNQLQIIQNKALRIIASKKVDEISIKELHELLKVDMISTRAKDLRDRYLSKNIDTENPITIITLYEYEQCKDEFTKFPTLLDAMTELDDEFEEELNSNDFLLTTTNLFS